jgi:G3E family GTPase
VSERPPVPITVIVPERHNVALLQRCAADPNAMLIASGETLAGAGLLGLLRVGRAIVIAPDVASRTPGCECCQVRLDLIDAVRCAVLRRTPPERLIVVVDRADTAPLDEATGDDRATDVVTVINTLYADGEIERLAHLGGLVVHVDACAASTRMASGFALWDPQVEAALAIADAIVVTGAKLLTEESRVAIADSLSALNRIGEVGFCSAKDIDVERLVHLDAWSGAPTSNSSPARDGVVSQERRGASPLYPGATVETVVLHRFGVLDPDATNAWLDRVVAESPRGLFRLHASLQVSTHHPRVCIRGSRSAMRSVAETPLGATGSAAGKQARDNLVVLIGRDLDRQALSESFESIEMAP